MLRIVALSDTHVTDKRLEDLEVPDGDILIHAGDATMVGAVGETARFMNWFKALPHKVKYFVPGNHDFWFEHYPNFGENTSIEVLINRFADDKRLRIFGSPYSHKYNDWAFGLDERGMGRFLQQIQPCKIDILITHGPPHGILDYYEGSHTNKDGTKLKMGQHLGFRSLRIFTHNVAPKVHIFGHVHSAHGHERVDKTDYYNVAILGDDYKVRYKPTVIDLDI